MGFSKIKLSTVEIFLIVLFGIGLGMIITIILPFWFWVLIAAICIFFAVWFFWKEI